MKQYIKFLLSLILILGACTKQQPSSKTSYEELKAKGYLNLTEDEKKVVIDDLHNLLRENGYFRLYNQSLIDMVYHSQGRKHAKGVKMDGQIPKNAKDALAFFKKQGFQDPEGYMKTQLSLIFSYGKMMTIFPELALMDTKTRISVISKARTGLSNVDLKKSFKIVKENLSSYR
jgi:hypothetical protein